MGESTQIGWTDHTFNSHIGCQRVSPACGGAKGVGGCYAEALVTGRMGYNPTSADPRRRLTLWGPPSTSTRQRTSPTNWRNPVKWNAAAKAEGVRRRVFCASLADVFEDHPDLPAVRADLWPLIELAKSRMENRPETQILGDTSTRVFGSGLASTLPTEPAVPFQPATINNVLGQLLY